MSIKTQILEAPETSGVYQFFDAGNNILYIGKAKNLKKRLLSYIQPDRLSTRIERMVFLAKKVETIRTETEVEALLLEHNLIKKHSPKFNILLRDDKTFPYIFINEHEFPQISKTRYFSKDINFLSRSRGDPQNRKFGPFAAATDVNRTIDVLKKSFLLRSCSDAEFSRRKKPCLEYQIKRCSAPCVNLISGNDYRKLVSDAADFLAGKSVTVQKELAQQMQRLSDSQQYEKAAVIRDRIKSLTSIQSKQNINIHELQDADIITIVTKNDQACIYISFFRGGLGYGAKPYFFEMNNLPPHQILSGFIGQFYLTQIPPKLILLNIEIEEIELTQSFLEKLAAEKITIKIPKQGDRLRIIKDQERIALQNLEQKIAKNINNSAIFLELKNIFNLPKIPKKIEVYDNSHISGEYAVGTLIAADINGFIKNGYRKFNIRFDEKNRDDTAMLKEVLQRRFKNGKIENPPDLIIIDGGLGQLSAAQEVFDQIKLDIPYICMAKGKDRNAGKEVFHQVGQQSFTMPTNHPVMYYLQNLRDEAHRFAITTHRKKRTKSLTKSALDEIGGIGKVRKKILLNHFGSVEKIKSAAVEDLMQVEGISRVIARKIYGDLHGKVYLP